MSRLASWARAWIRRNVWDPSFGYPMFGITGESAMWKFDAGLRHYYIGGMVRALNTPSPIWSEMPEAFPPFEV